MSFKVMSFNIEGFFSEREDMYQWEKRADLNWQMIQNYDPDLFGCQEVQVGNLAFYRKYLPKYDIHLGLRTIIQDDERTMYNPIFWKADQFEKCASGEFYLSQTPDKWSKSWDAMFVRGATWVKLQCVTNGKKFILLNTHLDHRGEQARIEGSKIIIKQIVSIRGENDLPIILTGDFNSRAWAPFNEEFYEYPSPIIPNALPSAGTVYNVYRDFGFLDTYLEAGHTNRLNMNTYHDYCGEVFPPAALRIDWILILNGVQKIHTKKFIIVRDAQPPIYPSDHYPIIAELSWEK